MRIIATLVSAYCGVLLAAAPPGAPVALIVDSRFPVAAETRRAMQQEVDSIFRSTGYAFQWVDRHLLRPSDSFPDLVMVRIEGRCDAPAEASASASVHPRAIAWAHQSESGGILPFADIDCSRVHSMLRPLTRQLLERPAALLVGQALGRVLAHELYHVLSGNSGHASRGVAQPSLSPLHLTAESLQFTRREIALLSQRSLAARNLPLLPASPAVVSPAVPTGPPDFSEITADGR